MLQIKYYYCYSHEFNRDAYNVILTLDGLQWSVNSFEKLPEGTQPQITPEELIEAELIIRADPQIIKLAADVGESQQVVEERQLVNITHRCLS
jgi:hypothetical protein